VRMREKICEEETIHESEKKSVRKSVGTRENPWGREKIREEEKIHEGERKCVGMTENR